MKYIFFMLLTFSTLTSANSESCTAYANRHEIILDRINFSKELDLKNIEHLFQKEMAQCKNSECFLNARNTHFRRTIEINELEKQQILFEYNNLANNCKN